LLLILDLLPGEPSVTENDQSVSSEQSCFAPAIHQTRDDFPTTSS